MLGIYCNKTYGAMTNHEDRDDGGYNNRNEDKNNDDNTASGSGSDVLIFDPIATPWSCLGLTEEGWVTTTRKLVPRLHMYLRVRIYLPYKHPINAIVNICHKLLYAKNFVLDLCC